MDLIARALIVGSVLPAAPPGVTQPGVPEITFDKMNRIFGEVASRFGYRSFQSNPEGTSGQIQKTTPGNAVVIQPGLLQVQDTVERTPELATDQVEDVFQIAAQHLQIMEVLQLGVKWVFNLPIPSRDAAGFVLHHLVRRSEDDLAELSLGGTVWAGTKFVTSSVSGDAQYTVLIEPLVADMTQLYLDVDANFPGSQTLDRVKERAIDVLQYVRTPLKNYIERL